MKRRQVIFFVTGLIAGLISVTLGSLESLIGILGLAYGVGPLFFFAVLGGIVITGAWRRIQADLLRYLAGMVLCTITYVVSMFTFFAVGGFSPNWFGVRPSANIIDFRVDVWLGLVAAGIVGASGITLFTFLLTGKWSYSLLRRLMLAGFLTILVTFMANLPFHNYWSFLGVLLPLGSAICSCLVGAQIWQHPEVTRQVAATAPTA